MSDADHHEDSRRDRGLAMYREVERPLGVLDPVIRTFTGGFALPLLSTLSETSGQYGDFFAHGVSPLPLFCFTGLVIYAIWAPRFRGAAAVKTPGGPA